jgi:hypothetical protein
MGPFPSYPQPIPDNALDLTPVTPGFTDDFANILGNAATPSDGFDLILSGPIQYVADHPAIMRGLDAELVPLDSTAAELATPFHQDFADTLAGFITQGDGDFQQYNVDLTGNTPPAPGKKPGSGNVIATYGATITITYKTHDGAQGTLTQCVTVSTTA